MISTASKPSRIARVPPAAKSAIVWAICAPVIGSGVHFEYVLYTADGASGWMPNAVLSA